MPELHIPEQFNAAAALVDSHVAQGRGGRPAILCGDRAVTYKGLYEGVNRFGNALLELGVRMEERVAILMPDTPEFVFAFFGAMKMGAVAIPMNTLLRPKDYEYLLNDSRSRVLLVHAALLDSIAPVRGELKYLQHVIVADGEAEGGLRQAAREAGRQLRTPERRPALQAASEAGRQDAQLRAAARPRAAVHCSGGCLRLDALLSQASPALEPADTSKDDAAFWLYSSGTTGFPKGAVHLHHDMIVEAEYYGKQVLGLTEDDLCFSVAKLFFAYGLGNGLYFALYVGGANVLLPGRPVPETVFDMIDRYGPTVFYSVPTNYAQLLHVAEKAGRTSLGRARMCVSAGEPLPKPIFERWRDRFGVEILDGIGSTEILHIFISNRPGRARAGSTGEIVPGYQAAIVDDDGNRLPPGQPGTLLIKGDSIAAGYWNKHERTKETFRGEWINTHDKFLVDADGFFWYQGRTDDMIKVSGMAVWPTEVEALLQEHPAVLESGVAGVEDAEGLFKPFAFVVLKEGHEPSPELARELQEFIKERAAKFKYPRWVEFVHDLPKTATGKIQRYKLRELGAAARWLHDQQR